MDKKKFAADSTLGRLLIALRAGSMEISALRERVSGNVYAAIRDGKRRGLIENYSGYYRITERGLAACTLRNPLAARFVSASSLVMSERQIALHRLNSLEHHPMTTQSIPERILKAIHLSGSTGITRQDLIAKIGREHEKAIDMGISRYLKRGMIRRPHVGFYVYGSVFGVQVPVITGRA